MDWVDLPYRMRPDAELSIVYADDRLVVVDKPAGMLSVPGRGPDRADCAERRVRDLFPHATGPLTVHRLDLETSGLLVFGLDRAAQRSLSMAFEARRVDKAYEAVLSGPPPADAGIVDAPIAKAARPRYAVDPTGRAARTHWRRIDLSHPDPAGHRVAFVPMTGRTHQLRLHAAYPAHDPLRVGSGGLGRPILGDSLYGDPESCERLLLHATHLAFPHPDDGRRIVLSAPAPF